MHQMRLSVLLSREFLEILLQAGATRVGKIVSTLQGLPQAPERRLEKTENRFLECQSSRTRSGTGENRRLEGAAFRPDDTRMRWHRPGIREIDFPFSPAGVLAPEEDLAKSIRFTQHAVAPAWSKILKELAAQQDAQAAFDALCEQARKNGMLRMRRSSVQRRSTAR